MLNDICRCHDGQCSVRYQCARWNERHDNNNNRLIHAATLKQAWVTHESPCTSYIGEPLESRDE